MSQVGDFYDFYDFYDFCGFYESPDSLINCLLASGFLISRVGVRFPGNPPKTFRTRGSSPDVHELATTTTDMAVLLSEQEAARPRVLAPATYHSGMSGVQSRGTAGRLPGGPPIFAVSSHQFVKHPG